jgi:hypothetical protein
VPLIVSLQYDGAEDASSSSSRFVVEWDGDTCDEEGVLELSISSARMMGLKTVSRDNSSRVAHVCIGQGVRSASEVYLSPQQQNDWELLCFYSARVEGELLQQVSPSLSSFAIPPSPSASETGLHSHALNSNLQPFLFELTQQPKHMYPHQHSH